jgi:hypothetical protein
LEGSVVARTVTCPDCGAVVPYGRLSCVACGSLLASVAGVGRRASPDAASPPAPPRDEPAVPAAAAPTAPVEPSAVEPAPVPTSPEAPVAGAWLPPSAAFAVPTDVAARPVQLSPAPSSALSAGASAAAAVASTPAPAVVPGRAGLLADLPFDAPDDLPGWLAAGAAAAVVVGFFLPWGDNGVIGGGLDGGYFSQWGLANAANLLPLGLALGALWFELAASVRRSPIRTGLLGLLLGAAITGLAFTYATSPFGLGVGGLVVAAGGIVLVGAGLLALRPRHAETGSVV